jgi:hypothetical protein
MRLKTTLPPALLPAVDDEQSDVDVELSRSGAPANRNGSGKTPRFPVEMPRRQRIMYRI